MIRRLLSALCSHSRTFRERRDHASVRDVMCFVCESCGQAWPVVSRSDREHREAKAAGTPLVSVGQRQTKANVTPIRKNGTR